MTGEEIFRKSHVFVVGEEIFSRIKACEEDQGNVVNPRDRSDAEHNAETWKKIEPGKRSSQKGCLGLYGQVN